jgi:hypothetical protein
MPLAILLTLALFSPWTDLIDSAFEQAAGDCGTCHVEGYTVRVRIERPGQDDLDQSFANDADARRWAQRQNGCGISVYFRPKAGGRPGLGSRSHCT